MLFAAYISWILSYSAKAVQSTLVNHFQGSVFSRLTNHQFWNPGYSWLNQPSLTVVAKAKGLNKLYLIAKRTILKWTTDGNNLFRAIEMKLKLLSLILFALSMYNYSFKSLSQMAVMHAGFMEALGLIAYYTLYYKALLVHEPNEDNLN